MSFSLRGPGEVAVLSDEGVRECSSATRDTKGTLIREIRGSNPGFVDK